MLLLQEKFEAEKAFEGLHTQFGAAHSFNVATDPKNPANKVGRFELRPGDTASGGTRTEVLNPEQANRKRWFGISFFIPRATFAKDDNNDILCQWHQGASPATSFRIEEDRMHMKIGNHKDTRKDYDLGPVPFDTWFDMEFDILFSPLEDGYINVSINDQVVLAHKGGNMYPLSTDIKEPRWKFGIYKSSWNDGGVTDSTLRVFYVDNIRMGDEFATKEEMSVIQVVLPDPEEPKLPDPLPDPQPEGPTVEDLKQVKRRKIKAMRDYRLLCEEEETIESLLNL